MRSDHMQRGDKQPLAELRPSSRYSSVADLDRHNTGTGESGSGERSNHAKLLQVRLLLV